MALTLLLVVVLVALVAGSAGWALARSSVATPTDGQAIDTAGEFFLCWTGCLSRPEVLGAAHPGRWLDSR